jgi:thioredoxin 1
MIMIELNVENWSQVIENNESVLVDVFGSNCGPCVTMESRLNELENANTGKIVFAKIHAMDNLDCVSKYGITGVPALLYFKSGKLVTKEVGLKTIDELEKSITKYLS